MIATGMHNKQNQKWLQFHCQLLIVLLSDIYSSSHPKEINDENDMMLFRRRVMDVMLKKKSNLEENLEHYRSEGVNPTGGPLFSSESYNPVQIMVETLIQN